MFEKLQFFSVQLMMATLYSEENSHSPYKYLGEFRPVKFTVAALRDVYKF